MGEKGSACKCLQQMGRTFVLPQRHFGCSRPSSAACSHFWRRGLLVNVCHKWVELSSYRSVILGVAVQAARHAFVSGQLLGEAVQAAQHVFISGQREAASFWV